MKKNSLLILLIAAIPFIACKKSLKDESEQNLNEAQANEIVLKAKIVSQNPLKLESPDLIEKTATIEGTNIKTYGYVLKNPTNTASRNVQPVDPCWKIENGWFLYGRCAVYGTMFTDCSGNQLFSPCGSNCIGFHDICPPGDDCWDCWMAVSPNNKIKTLDLKFKK